jgi:arylsulfatase A-like enzyme
MNKFFIIAFLFFSVSLQASQVQNYKCPNCNLIVISLSNARPKNMSIYGYQRPTTPHIEKYFNNSFIFTNAIAPASLTFVDALSFFYSLNPIKHQIFSRRKIKKNFQRITRYDSLTSILKKEKYQTAAFVSEEDYNYDWGMSKGFDLYFDKTKYADYQIIYRPQNYNVGIKDLSQPAIDWINKNKKSKFFLFLQGFDMHCPYGPNENFSKLYFSNHNNQIPFETDCFMNRSPLKPIYKNGKEYYQLSSFLAFKLDLQKNYLFTKDDLKYLQSRYDAELTKTDFYLSKIFDHLTNLGLDKNTIVMFMSEHGDNLGENNYYMKSNTYAEGNLHNANLNFALMLKIPNQKSLQKYQHQIIQTIDIAPTLLDILNLPTSKTMQGKTFLPILNTSQEINDANYGYSIRYNIDSIEDFATTYNQLEVVQNHNWKFYQETLFDNNNDRKISTKKFLFNLTKDPEEKKNLINSNYNELIFMNKLLESKAKYYNDSK